MSPSDARVGLLALLWLSLPGCAWLTQNQAATAEYSRQVTTASMRVADLEQQLAEAEQRVAQLEETVRMHGQQEATRLENLDQVNTEINRLRGAIEELQFQVTEIKTRLDAEAIRDERRMLHAERRLASIEKTLGLKPPPPPTDAELGLATTATAATDPANPGATGTTPTTDPATTGTTAEPEAPPVPDTAVGKLERAIETMKAGQQGAARYFLEQAITAHPDAKELPEIRYRLGETWFNEGQYGKAVRAFQAVIENHAKSEWAAWAMLRQGECFEKLNRPGDAKAFYTGVTKDYPKSDAAKDAKQALERLGK